MLGPTLCRPLSLMVMESVARYRGSDSGHPEPMPKTGTMWSYSASPLSCGHSPRIRVLLSTPMITGSPARKRLFTQPRNCGADLCLLLS